MTPTLKRKDYPHQPEQLQLKPGHLGLRQTRQPPCRASWKRSFSPRFTHRTDHRQCARNMTQMTCGTTRLSMDLRHSAQQCITVDQPKRGLLNGASLPHLAYSSEQTKMINQS